MIKIAIVTVAALVVLFVASEVVKAAGTGHSIRGADVRITRCGVDVVSHHAEADGSVNGAPRRLSFSIAFTDAAGDEEDRPVAIGAAAPRFVVRSTSSFPGGEVHCAVVDPNLPVGL